MKLQVINIDGKKTENIELSDKIFSVKPNKNLIQSIVEWQLNHFKPRTAKTKQRSEIKGSTAKIYAQKGTGGARHSSRKAPIFVGGCVAHGPKGNVYRIKKINKRVRKLGILFLLSQKMFFRYLLKTERDDFGRPYFKGELRTTFLTSVSNLGSSGPPKKLRSLS